MEILFQMLISKLNYKEGLSQWDFHLLGGLYESRNAFSRVRIDQKFSKREDTFLQRIFYDERTLKFDHGQNIGRAKFWIMSFRSYARTIKIK